MKKFREWLIGTYNGLYKIILEPSMPSRQTVFLIVLAFIIGLLWAYALAPTIYYDGDPSQLEQSWQNEWVRLLADRYVAVTSTSATGPEFDDSMVSLLSAVDDPLSIVDSLGITDPRFRDLAQQAQPGRAAPARPSIVASLQPFLVGSIVLIVLTVVISLLGRILIYPNLIEPIVKRLRGGTAASDEATMRTIDAMRAARSAEARAKEAPSVMDAELGEPVTRKMSVYLMGRGQYDDSFEIEDQNDMFLGECGAAIAETIGEGSPAKVAAIEVWLFDKDDFVRTLTGVFASTHAANDPATRSKLEPKGQVVMMQPGAVLVLDTNTLRMRATIVEMAYGSSDTLPPNSFIENITIEIAVWQKAASSMPAATRMASAASAGLPSIDIDFDPPPMPPSQPASAPIFSPPPPPRQAPPPPPDDDPFGGTGDFTPIG
jgi:hypothetical protein